MNEESRPVPEARSSYPNIPKWLIYGLVGKVILVILIVLAVLWYAGIFG